MKTPVTSELVVKIPIKVYMCVLNNSRVMAANDFILNLL